MAAPTLQAEGAIVSNTTGVLTVTLAAHQANDILVLVLQYWGPNTAGDAANIPNPDAVNWTQFGNQIKYPDTGNADGAIAVFWRRATSGATANPACSRAAGWDTGTDSLFAGRAYTIRGCATSGNPHDQGNNAGPYTTANQNFAAGTVTGLQRLVVQFAAIMDNIALGAAPAGWTAGTAVASATGTGARFQTFFQTSDSNTPADASAATAPTHGAYGFKAISFRPQAQTLAVGVSSETDAAQALGRQKQRAVGIAAEADAAQTVGHYKTRAVGTAAETDAAQLLGRQKRRAVGLASEVDLALALSHRKQRAVGAASELDVAQALGKQKRRAVGLAAETDLALAIGHARGKTVGPASEVDLALSIGHRKARLVGTAAETDLALTLGRRKVLALGTASEFDEAGDIFPPGVQPYILLPTFHIVHPPFTGLLAVKRRYGASQPGDRGMAVELPLTLDQVAVPAPVLSSDADAHDYSPVDAYGNRGMLAVTSRGDFVIGGVALAVPPEPPSVALYDVALYDVAVYAT